MRDDAVQHQPKPDMSVDDFLAWAEAEQGRHELVDGQVYAMAPERAGHARAKASVHSCLSAAVARGALACEAMPDGMTVRIDASTAYEPDALVYRGPRISNLTVEVADPLIVVEVLSPSTGFYDRHDKLAGYFAVPSIRHYLTVNIDRRLVIHHERDGDTILTRLLPSGALRLDPPGLDLVVEDLLGPEEAVPL